MDDIDLDKIKEDAFLFHWQNCNGRESEEELFKLGIDACIEEFMDYIKQYQIIK